MELLKILWDFSVVCLNGPFMTTVMGWWSEPLTATLTSYSNIGREVFARSEMLQTRVDDDDRGGFAPAGNRG
jgi:hypothetical protein